MTAEERLTYIGGIACELLAALRPWESHGQDVRSAAARLTVALAAVPESEASDDAA